MRAVFRVRVDTRNWGVAPTHCQIGRERGVPLAEGGVPIANLGFLTRFRVAESSEHVGDLPEWSVHQCLRMRVRKPVRWFPDFQPWNHDSTPILSSENDGSQASHEWNRSARTNVRGCLHCGENLNRQSPLKEGEVPPGHGEWATFINGKLRVYKSQNGSPVPTVESASCTMDLDVFG